MQSMATKEQKAVVREALHAKLGALLDIENALNLTTQKKGKADEMEGNEINDTFKELSQWVKSIENEYPVLYARHAAREGR